MRSTKSPSWTSARGAGASRPRLLGFDAGAGAAARLRARRPARCATASFARDRQRLPAARLPRGRRCRATPSTPACSAARCAIPRPSRERLGGARAGAAGAGQGRLAGAARRLAAGHLRRERRAAARRPRRATRCCAGSCGAWCRSGSTSCGSAPPRSTPLPGQEEPRRLLLGFGVEQLLAQLEEAFAAAGVRIGQITNTSLALLAGARAPARRRRRSRPGRGRGRGLHPGLRPRRRAGAPPLQGRSPAALPEAARGGLVARDLKLTRNFLDEHFPGVRARPRCCCWRRPRPSRSGSSAWREGLGVPAAPLDGRAPAAAARRGRGGAALARRSAPHARAPCAAGGRVSARRRPAQPSEPRPAAVRQQPAGDPAGAAPLGCSALLLLLGNVALFWSYLVGLGRQARASSPRCESRRSREQQRRPAQLESAPRRPRPGAAERAGRVPEPQDRRAHLLLEPAVRPPGRGAARRRAPDPLAPARRSARSERRRRGAGRPRRRPRASDRVPLEHRRRGRRATRRCSSFVDNLFAHPAFEDPDLAARSADDDGELHRVRRCSVHLPAGRGRRRAATIEEEPPAAASAAAARTRTPAPRTRQDDGGRRMSAESSLAPAPLGLGAGPALLPRQRRRVLGLPARLRRPGGVAGARRSTEQEQARAAASAERDELRGAARSAPRANRQRRSSSSTTSASRPAASG